MSDTRRGFFGKLAGLLAIPFVGVVASKPSKTPPAAEPEKTTAFVGYNQQYTVTSAGSGKVTFFGGCGHNAVESCTNDCIWIPYFHEGDESGMAVKP